MLGKSLQSSNKMKQALGLVCRVSKMKWELLKHFSSRGREILGSGWSAARGLEGDCTSLTNFPRALCPLPSHAHWTSWAWALISCLYLTEFPQVILPKSLPLHHLYSPPPQGPSLSSDRIWKAERDWESQSLLTLREREGAYS